METLEYCKCRMEYLKEAVQREQVESEGRESPSALVVFRDRESAATAMQVFIHHDRKYWITHPAPAPGEVR